MCVCVCSVYSGDAPLKFQSSVEAAERMTTAVSYKYEYTMKDVTQQQQQHVGIAARRCCWYIHTYLVVV